MNVLSASPDIFFNKNELSGTKIPEGKENEKLSDLAVEEPQSIGEATKHLNDLVEKCKKAYSEHRLDEAHRLMVKCEQIRENSKGDALAVIDSILNNQKNFFEVIKTEHAYMLKILKELTLNEDWVADSVGSNGKFYYKYVPNTEMVMIKVDITADVPIFDMLTLVNEITLWDQWLPFIKRSSQVKRIHRSSAVYYLELGLPYPLSNREVHLYGYGVNRLHENGSVLILAESVDDNKEFLEQNEVKKVENSGTVNMDIHFAGFEIIPVDQKKCRIVGVLNINPKFTWLPASLLNFVMKKAVQFIMDRLVKRAKNFKGSVWEKEALKEEKKAFYIWLRQVVEDYYKKQNLKANPSL